MSDFTRQTCGTTSVTAPFRANMMSRFHPDDECCNRDKYPSVPRLRIRPERIDKLPVEEHRQQNAAARAVEYWGNDDGQRHVADEEWQEVPAFIDHTRQIECRQVPDSPGRTDQRTGPDWSYVALKYRLSHAAPTEFLDRTQKKHHRQKHQGRGNAARRQWRQQRTALEQRAGHVDKRNADQDKQPPHPVTAPKQ